jgi:hypothetical protein
MPQLTSYTKDTESNILSNPPTADGQIAFATDTYKFYISDGTNWRTYEATKVYGNYDLTESTSLSSRPLYHIDTSSSNTVLNGNNTSPSNGDGVASITCKATGKKFISDFATEQPTYVSASGTPFMGETTGDARIGGLNVMQFDAAQMLAYDYAGKSSFHRCEGWTAALVLRCQVTAGHSTLWNPVFGSSLAGVGVNLRENANYGYINYRHSSTPTSVNRAMSYGLDSRFTQGNYPFILFCRFMKNSSNYLMHTTWNINNNQFDDTYSNTTADSQNVIYGMMLGANYAYKTTSKRFVGEIGEFLFFDTMLTNSSVNTLGNHLATKWSLNWSNL